MCLTESSEVCLDSTIPFLHLEMLSGWSFFLLNVLVDCTKKEEKKDYLPTPGIEPGPPG